MMIRTGRRVVAVITLFSQLIACAQTKVLEEGADTMSPSIYYKPSIVFDSAKCTEEELKSLISPQGKVLETVCPNDFKRCLMEGSCFITKDSRTRSYNYHSRIDDVPRFTEVDLRKCPFGYGVRSTCLDPYYTVAADLKIYKVGDVIFVPRLVGAAMPDGIEHDGFLVIRDSGAAIQGAGRFDFFTGFYNLSAKENTMVRLGFADKNKRFDFRMATTEEAEATRVRRGYPRLRNEIVVRALEEIESFSGLSLQ
jgi:3D (Asp-Asp-Asp) domain-containing protein